MTPEEFAILNVEVKLLDIHWTEILRILANLPAGYRFGKKDQLEWLVKRGQPVLRELALQHAVDRDTVQEVHHLMDECMEQMKKAKEELDRLRKLAEESLQFFENINESVGFLNVVSIESWRESYRHDFVRMRQALTTAGYQTVAVGE